MLDRQVLRFTSPALTTIGRALAARGATADGLTMTGFAFGMGAAFAIALGYPLTGLLLGALRTLCDGLDGAVARLTTTTDRGAYLDVTLDFLFYASIPVAFACADPITNSVPATLLLAAFIGTGTTFLAFAVLAERRGLESASYPEKGIYYLTGLTEGTETLLAFAAMCLWPAYFGWIATAFALLCVTTIGGRLIAGWRLLA